MADKRGPVWETLIRRVAVALAAALVLLATAGLGTPASQSQNPQGAPQASTSNANSPPVASTPALPRGKKLILKDGSFHLIREYRVEGDRVRYYSVDRSQWEVIPAALVDWDATRKAEEAEAQRDAAIDAKVHTQEAGRIVQPLDIDASLEVAPGVFLPSGEKLFVFDGKTIVPLSKAETDSKLSKGRLLEQVLVPVPIIPTRHNVSIHGTRAKLRVNTGQPEFYIRTADAREPQMELVRAKVHGDERLVEHVDTFFGGEQASQDSVPIQRWEVARGVYRFTLGQPLPPGEYAFAEIVRDEGMSLYVWDFGVDVNATTAGTKQK